jgi:hypothetical protein
MVITVIYMERVGKIYEAFIYGFDCAAIHSLLDTYRNRLSADINIGRRDS